MSIETNEISRDVAASGGSTATCQSGGPYKCNTHSDVIVSFSKGQKFTNCPRSIDSTKSAAAGHTTTWVMVREADSSAFDAKVQQGAESL